MDQAFPHCCIFCGLLCVTDTGWSTSNKLLHNTHNCSLRTHSVYVHLALQTWPWVQGICSLDSGSTGRHICTIWTRSGCTQPQKLCECSTVGPLTSFWRDPEKPFPNSGKCLFLFTFSCGLFFGLLVCQVAQYSEGYLKVENRKIILKFTKDIHVLTQIVRNWQHHKLPTILLWWVGNVLHSRLAHDSCLRSLSSFSLCNF